MFQIFPIFSDSFVQSFFHSFVHICLIWEISISSHFSLSHFSFACLHLFQFFFFMFSNLYHSLALFVVYFLLICNPFFFFFCLVSVGKISFADVPSVSIKMCFTSNLQSHSYYYSRFLSTYISLQC